MKKAILLLILSVSLSLSILSQTKKIAHRSHSGSDFAFSFAGVDNFGNFEPLKIALPDTFEKSFNTKPSPAHSGEAKVNLSPQDSIPDKNENMEATKLEEEEGILKEGGMGDPRKTLVPVKGRMQLLQKQNINNFQPEGNKETRPSTAVPTQKSQNETVISSWEPSTPVQEENSLPILIVLLSVPVVFFLIGSTIRLS